jgi:streptomycin 6-kinase
VLKLTPPGDRDADHEGVALEAWNGAGAVRLLYRDDEHRALLVDRCRPGTRLWDENADQIDIGTSLLERLTIPLSVGHGFRTVDDEAVRWAEELRRSYDDAEGPFEQSLRDYALDVFSTPSTGPADAFLINQDLHGGNILRSEREPWLVIDPKPLAGGEREVAAVGLLRNAAGDSDLSPAAVTRWLDALADLGLERERLRGWGVAHALAWGHDDKGWIGWSIEVARTIRTA